MNVIRFDIEITFAPTVKERVQRACEKRSWTRWVRFKNTPPDRPSIKTFICTKLRDSSDNPVNYQAIAQEKWNGLTNKKIRALCPSQAILGALNVSKVECFVFHTDSISIKDRITVEVIILSEVENIDHSVSVVFDEIERQLTTACKVKALLENHVFLFPYDRKDNDIWATDYRIRANFSGSMLTPQEMFRALIMTGIMVVLLIALFLGGYSGAIAGWLAGTSASCGIFLLTEFVLKHFRPRFVRGKTLSVSINNLSTVVDDPPVVPYSEGNSPQLQNPVVSK